MKTQQAWGKRLALLLGWALGLALLLWLLQDLDTHALLQRADQIHPAWWLTATVVWLFSFVCRALRVQQEWHWKKAVGLTVALRLVLLHNAAVLLLPFRSGEAGYPLLVRRVFHAPTSAALRSLVWLRVQDACILAVLGIICWPGLPLWLSVVCPMLLLFVILLPPVWWLRLLKNRQPWAKLLRSVLHRRAPRTAWLLSLVNWLSKLSVVALLLGQLLPLTAWSAWQAAIGGELATLLPLQGPASLGTYEAGVWLGAGLARSATETVAGAALLVHVFCLAVSLGAAALAGFWWRWPDPAEH